MSFVDRYIIIPDGNIRECLSLTGHPSTHLFTHPSIHPFLPHKWFKRTSLRFKDIVSVQQRQCLGRLVEIKCKAFKKKDEDTSIIRVYSISWWLANGCSKRWRHSSLPHLLIQRLDSKALISRSWSPDQRLHEDRGCNPDIYGEYSPSGMC